MYKHICFYVTEIAGLLGYNNFKNKETELQNFIDRILYNKKREEPDISDDYKNIIESTINEQDIKKVQENIKLLDNSEEISSELKNIIKHKIYTERGRSLEELALNDYKRECPYKIKSSNEFNKQFYMKNNKGFLIGGRIDGSFMDDNKNLNIIEIKNRQVKILEHLPKHELIQIECYLRILNAKKCIFIQRYDNNNVISEYIPDNHLWSEILVKCSEITDTVNKLKSVK